MSMMTNGRSAGRDQAAEGDAVRPRTGAALRAAIEDVPPPGDEFSRHIAAAVALLRSEVSDSWDRRPDLS
jgi:hypothetical protein